MSKFDNRPNTALLIVDMQTGVIAGAHNRDAVVDNVRKLTEKARQAGALVIWIQHSDQQLVLGDDQWQIVPELAPTADEPRIDKIYCDSFEDTNLETDLCKSGIGRLFVAGAQTDACIRSTIHGAFVRGYDVILVGDAHTTEDLTAWGAPPPAQVIAHTNMYWAQQSAPQRMAGTVETKNVSFDHTH